MNLPDIARGVGLPPAAHVTAAEQLQKTYPRVGIQPLPAGAPGRVTPDRVSIGESGSAVRFVVVGDSGGIKDPNSQIHVANAIIDRLVQDPSIAFMYHLGDEVYFNGDADQYAPQFYEPYAHFNRPIVGIPGNHDGNVAVDDNGNHTGRQPLDTFMVNFCDVKPSIPNADPQFEYGRHTQTQPYCDWTLNSQAITMIGLYSNVPSGGYLHDTQQLWLAQELQNAPANRPVVVSLHHPPYSVDAHHGGSKHMGDAIDRASVAAQRYPDLVLSGHVHDYQRFTRTVLTGKYSQRDIPYVVLGNSGYHNLHALAGDAEPHTDIISKDDERVTFEYGDAHNWGFMVVTVAGHDIVCEYVSVAHDGTVHAASDMFHIFKGKVKS